MMRAFVMADAEPKELPFLEGVAQFEHAELVWLVLDGRAPGAAEWIAEQKDIPDIARAALMAAETRPRSDLVGQGVIINLRGLGKTPEDDPDALVSLRFWAETGRVILVTFRTPLALDTVIDEFLSARIRDPGDLLSAFASAITDGLDPDVANLGDALDDCELKVEVANIHPTRRDVTRVRARAIAFRRFVAPQRQALAQLSSAPLDWLDDDDRLHLREGADRAARMAEELESVRERAMLMHEELTDRRSELMDARALLISIVALVFLPLTFITGLLGMNVDGIPYAHQPWAFWGVTGVCLFLAILVVGWFVRAHWISGD
ncbi:MAG: CorA family divalent cation transporter [Sphingomonadaceae bacterium]